MSIYALVEIGKQVGESDKAYAERVTIPEQSLSDWKAGRAKPNALNYLKIAFAANMTLEEALRYSEALENDKVKEAWNKGEQTKKSPFRAPSPSKSLDA